MYHVRFEQFLGGKKACLKYHEFELALLEFLNRVDDGHNAVLKYVADEEES